MTITKELINKMAPKGNMTPEQLDYIGETPKKGWQARIIGREISYMEYVDLCELGWMTAQKKIGTRPVYAETQDVGVPKNITFEQQYKHPNWQRMRLKVLERDGFKCTKCKNRNMELHVHHKKYPKKGFVWNVPMDWLITLCKSCHYKKHPKHRKTPTP